MRYVHTMVRVRDLDAALDFYVHKLGLVETRRAENEFGRYTLVFLAAPADVDPVRDRRAPELELTWNWDDEIYTGGRNFGHIAYRVENIYAFCERLARAGVVINRPPRDGHLAFVRSPDGITIEIMQEGESLLPQEPWKSLPNIGTW